MVQTVYFKTVHISDSFFLLFFLCFLLVLSSHSQSQANNKFILGKYSGSTAKKTL